MKLNQILIYLLILVSVSFAESNLQPLLNDVEQQFHLATTPEEYRAVAQEYELLISEARLLNGPIYYTTANCWYLAGELGHAILNYRRAEAFMPRSSELQHNLALTQKERMDSITPKQNPVLKKLFLGSATVRGMLFSTSWILFWSALIWHRRRKRTVLLYGLVFTGLFSAFSGISLIAESILNHRKPAGVILVDETIGRKGDGPMYTPAFIDPLHSGTEFQQIEKRNHWRHIELPDGRRCWISETSAELVRL